MRRRQETVREQVAERMQITIVDNVLSIMKDMLIEEVDSAPLLTPPIATGMTETIECLKAILLKQNTISQEEYKQVRTHGPDIDGYNAEWEHQGPHTSSQDSPPSTRVL